jgi:putative zinc ribbon protein
LLRAGVRLSMADTSTFLGSRYWVSGYPHLVEQWDTERNGSLTPGSVSAGSGRLIWWKCRNGPDHSWRAKPNNRSAGAGCPFCANRSVSVTNNLNTCAPRIAAEWHVDKNGLVGPEAVTATSTRVCWWQCSKRPEHQWRAAVRDRTRGDRGCPYCTRKRVSNDVSLASRHPRIAADWHPSHNGDLSPADVAPGSKRRVWWLCRDDRRHCWQATVDNRVRRASECPHCRRGTSSRSSAQPRTRTTS